MKFIFFAFRNRYRYKDLNNFLNSKFYGKYFLLNLGGPFKHLIAKIFQKLKIGFAISCDGRPLIKKKSGINFFIRGTNLNIPKNFRNCENNYVSIQNPFKKDKNVFQVYPVNIRKTEIKKDIKMIFMASVNTSMNPEEEKIWNNCKNEIFKDFTIIDKLDFWEEKLSTKDLEIIIIFYRKIKLLLRFEIAKYLKEKLGNQFILFGNDWNNYSINSLSSEYNNKKNNRIYNGNICLDLGSIEGSSSLYSRSNQIIEAGGLIIQSKQIDSDEKWNELSNKILFNNFESLEELIRKLMSDKDYSNEILNKIYLNFKDVEKKIESNFDKIFNS